MLLSSEQQDPCSVAEAKSSYDHARLVEAMESEIYISMQSLHRNKVWALVELPPNRKVIGSKWVFKRKVNANGEVERHKARLVAQGFSQKYGLDYEEMFSPVVRFESIRSVIALGAQHKLQLHQMDVSTSQRRIRRRSVYATIRGVCRGGKGAYGLLPETQYLWIETVSTILEPHSRQQTQRNEIQAYVR